MNFGKLKVRIKTETIVPKKYLFVFPDSESLTACLVSLYRHKVAKNSKSHLYKSETEYRLIAETSFPCNLISEMKEYVQIKHTNDTDLAYTEEYFTELIHNNAVDVIGKAFSKEP